MSAKRLYTAVLDYKGGTFIAQVRAPSPGAALSKWVSEIKDEDLTEWGIGRGELANITKSEDVVPLDGPLNVWCVSGSVRGGLALINVIATDESPET